MHPALLLSFSNSDDANRYCDDGGIASQGRSDEKNINAPTESKTASPRSRTRDSAACQEHHGIFPRFIPLICLTEFPTLVRRPFCAQLMRLNRQRSCKQKSGSQN